MGKHTEFILSPITNILKDAVTASAGIGNGIETYPLCDYIMQSVFLKMTGFQEQKMKCICWEMATNDYEYRRELLAGEDKLGECSSYDSKNKIYIRLVKQIYDYNYAFESSKLIQQNNLQNRVALAIEDIFLHTNLLVWGQGDFNEYKAIWKNVEHKHFVTENKNLFPEIRDAFSLKDIYKNNLYKHRNRCAHNTQAYQQNLPSLKTLTSENYKYENYFVWFAILVLIDEIFIELYKEYLKVLEDNI